MGNRWGRLPAIMLVVVVNAGRCPAAEAPGVRAECPCPAASPSSAAGGAGGAAAYDGMVPDSRWVGLSAASCSTSSCHGGPRDGLADVQSFAATVWSDRDPHARAYEALFQPRSVRMARLLGIPAAHESHRCLVCHSVQDASPEPLPELVLADGVACAACHGDATGWKDLHTLATWKNLTPAEREALGYRNLTTPGARAATCVRCHVGDDDHEVDHDLIAAGHPRLLFEFAAYQRLEPRHWSPLEKAETDPDFTARSWTVGQLVTLEAVARLVELRATRAAADLAAGRPSHWPELAEFDCYACHRALGPTVGRAPADFTRPPAPGSPSWQPWYAAAAELVAAGLASEPAIDARRVGKTATDLRRLLATDWAATDPARLERVVFEARGLASAARSAAAEADRLPRVVLDDRRVRIESEAAADPLLWRSWDASTQAYLALEAARAGGPAMLGPSAPPPPGSTRDRLDRLRESLLFSPGGDGPRGFDGQRFSVERAKIR